MMGVTGTCKLLKVKLILDTNLVLVLVTIFEPVLE